MRILALALAVFGEDARFRIFDIRDERPIADAVLELWTEEGVAPFIAATRLAVLRSGPDGTGLFEYQVGGIRPDLVRVQRAGYASRTVSLSDLEDGVELYPAMPLTGRVVDLDGQPVPRAIVRSREVCAHAISAAETVTDADGRFSITDFPSDDQGAELEVVPRDHVPLADLEVAMLRRLQARDGSFDLFVPRRAPIHVRVLDGEGRPMTLRRVSSETRPFVAGWTDALGFALLPPQPEWGAPLSVFEGTKRLQLPGGFVPSSGSFDAQPFEFQRAQGAGRLVLDVRAPVGAERPPETHLIAANGATFEGRELEGLALGPATVTIGEDFSPWIERITRIDVTAEPQTLVLDTVPAPAVEFLVADDALPSLLLVQAGATGRRYVLDHADDLRIHVLANVALTFVLLHHDGEVRRARLGPLVSGSTPIDLRDPITIVRAGTPEPEARDEEVVEPTSPR